MIFWRPKALYKGEKPSQNGNLLATNWRPKTITKMPVGKFSGGQNCKKLN
jgi:hypothetical protein